MSNELESPSGLDLEPKPPETARVSAKVAWAIVAFGVVVGGLIVYGLYSRGEHAKTAQAAAEEKRPEAATVEADKLVNDLAPPFVAKPSPPPRPGTLLPLSAGAQAHRTRSSDESVPDLTYRGGSNNSFSQSPSNTQHELTPEEKALSDAYHQEQAALAAPTLVRASMMSSGPTSSSGASGVPDSTRELAQMLASDPAIMNALGRGGTATPSSSALVSSGSSSSYDSQNAQSAKEVFLEKARAEPTDDYLKSTRVAPMGKYEIKAGWDIPAIMEQGLNSDLPGELRALVRSNVYDTATGKYLLIPQGSRLIGHYDSHISYAQSRVQVVWNRIIFPDASSIDLGGMVGQDAAGMAGLHDKVDNHYKRLAGFALLTSIFSAGIELSQNRSNTNLLVQPTVGQSVSQSVGQQMGELGAEITQRNLNIQPTIKISTGYRFNVRVNKDLLFDAPYSPFHPSER
jgi:type IV secretion system protein VirB10